MCGVQLRKEEDTPVVVYKHVHGLETPVFVYAIDHDLEIQVPKTFPNLFILYTR